MKVLWIAYFYLKRMFMDPLTWLWLLVMPVILTLLLGSVNKFPRTVPVAVVDHDGSEYACLLIAGLKAEDALEVRLQNEDQARRLLAKQQVGGLIIIPAGFGQTVENGGKCAVTALTPNRGTTPSLINETLTGVLARLKADAAAADLALGRAGIQGTKQRRIWREYFQQADQRWKPYPPIAVITDYVKLAGSRLVPAGNEHSSPAFITTFVLMMSVIGAGTLTNSKVDGTLARLKSTPTHSYQVMSGFLLGFFLQGLLQSLLLIAFGYWVLGVNWGHDPFALILLVIAFVLSATGLGSLVASTSYSLSQARVVGVLIVVVANMLGGCWWPLELVPHYMQKIAWLVPSGWAMEGFNNLITRGLGLAEVGPEIFALLNFAWFFVFLGVKIEQFL